MREQTNVLDAVSILGVLGPIARDPLKDTTMTSGGVKLSRTITSVQVSDKGMVQITTSTNETFAFHPTMRVWLRVNDQQNPFGRDNFLKNEDSFGPQVTLFKKMKPLHQVEVLFFNFTFKYSLNINS